MLKQERDELVSKITGAPITTSGWMWTSCAYLAVMISLVIFMYGIGSLGEDGSMTLVGACVILSITITNLLAQARVLMRITIMAHTIEMVDIIEKDQHKNNAA